MLSADDVALLRSPLPLGLKYVKKGLVNHALRRKLWQLEQKSSFKYEGTAVESEEHS